MKSIHVLLLFVALLPSSACRQNTVQSSQREESAALLLDAKATAGRQVFLKQSMPRCSQCHALREAGARGRIGTDLDATKPNIEKVRRAVTDGFGIMPSQADRLSAEQIEAVAYYVAAVADKAN